MRYTDFEAMVRRLGQEVAPEFKGALAGIEVSRATLPHPERPDVYTLGECIPLQLEAGGGTEVQSRVVLYYGSFLALSRLNSEFNWQEEAWETLTHELRHHLEWQARLSDLEAFDEAAEHNFARQEGQPYDPLFYLSGEPVGQGVYRLDDDFFLDQVVRAVPAEIRFLWHGRRYRGEPPAGVTLPALFQVEGVEEPPPGDLLLGLRRSPGLLELFRRPTPWQGRLQARPDPT